MSELGRYVVSFFEDYLKVQKGLRPNTIRSYRDALKLFLAYVADVQHRSVTRLTLADLDFDKVLSFLQDLEVHRNNHIQTRNQRLAGLRSFFRYLASRVPETMAEAQRIEAICTKRCPPSPTHYLETDEVEHLLRAAKITTEMGLRDRAILTLFYNTGARVQEVADLRVGDIDLNGPYRVRLHGKGDKWRTCPLWSQTVDLLKQLDSVRTGKIDTPLFLSRLHRPMTRFGLYKLVKRYATVLTPFGVEGGKRLSPHIFRHTAAVHLLESGVDINVIRAWLGHVSLETTNRYAEITLRMKEAAVVRCTPPDPESSEGSPQKRVWHKDPDLMKWLDSL